MSLWLQLKQTKAGDRQPLAEEMAQYALVCC